MESDGKVITMCVTCNLNQHLVCPFGLQNGSVHFVYKMEEMDKKWVMVP